jgi:hypothetical protein
MRYLLALLLMVPAFAEEPQQAKPADPAPAQAAAPSAPASSPAAEPSPAPSGGEWFTGSIDLGFRFVTGPAGSFQEYRSIVDQRQGPELTGLDFTIQDPKRRLFDRLNARAYGWGGQLYNSAHLDVTKKGVYNFTADYRNAAYFNAVPSFANTFAPAGFNEQAFDVRRRTATMDLDLFPNSHVSPYLSYSHNSGSGNGIDTWVLNPDDEFAVPTTLRDRTDNYRGGVRFEFKLFHVTLEQGGTTFKDDDAVNYTGSNPGDSTVPILGQTLGLNTLQQAYGIRGNSVYSKVLFTSNPFSWLDLYGQFLYSEPKVDVHYSSVASGNFVNLSTLLLYSAQSDMGTGVANQPHTTANLGFELRPFKRLRVIESWMTDRSHDAASPYVLEGLYLQGLSASSVTALNYAQIVNYNQNQFDVLYDVTSKITLRGGFRYVWGNSTVLAGQLSQTGSLVSGDLNRKVGLAGATIRPWQKLTVNLDYEGASSDQIYFRTSLNDYQRARARVRYQATNSLSLQARFSVLDNQNPATDIRYDFRSRDNALAVYWTPAGLKRITLTGEYDRSTMRSNMSILLLPFLAPAVSAYRDNAHTATSAIDVVLPGYSGMSPKLTLGGSLFVSSGSRPTEFYQPLARLSLPLQKHIYWNTEWQYYGYGEQFYLYEGFRTHMFLTGVRLIR